MVSSNHKFAGALHNSKAWLVKSNVSLAWLKAAVLCRRAVITPVRPGDSKITGVSLTTHQGSLVQIDLELSGITAGALKSSVVGTAVLHQCLEQQHWTLSFKVSPKLGALER